MDDTRDDQLLALLRRVAAGSLDPVTAAKALRGGVAPSEPAQHSPVADVATPDHRRAARCGFPEVVLCEGKRPADAARIAVDLLTRAPRLLLTRATAEHAAALHERRPDAVWHERAHCLVVDPEPLPRRGRVAVVCAGTADLPVAAEAAVTATVMGCEVAEIRDVGVAGLHRLLDRLEEIRAADAVVAAAGMEGALPSVLGGLLDRPVVAVPTSVGYGVGLGGLAALTTMLASCAAGVVTVNIDNGFGAGYAAALIARGRARPDRAADGPAKDSEAPGGRLHSADFEST